MSDHQPSTPAPTIILRWYVHGGEWLFDAQEMEITPDPVGLGAEEAGLFFGEIEDCAVGLSYAFDGVSHGVELKEGEVIKAMFVWSDSYWANGRLEIPNELPFSAHDRIRDCQTTLGLMLDGIYRPEGPREQARRG